MDSCSQTVTNEEFNAAVSQICSTSNGESIWITALTDKQDLLETDKLFLPKRENICPFKSTDISLKKRTQLSVVCSFMYGRRGNQPLKKDSERQSSLKNTFASGTSCRLTKTPIFCIEENNWCCQVNSDL
jgi:hypothetical protein